MMLRISRLVLGMLVSTQVCTTSIKAAETHKQCHSIKTDGPVIFVSEPYTEVSPSSPFTLGCRVCIEKHHKIKVSWEKNGSVLAERDGIRLKHKHKSLYQLVVKKAKKEDLGDYSCVINNPGHKTTKGTFHVGFVPVPPKLVPLPDGNNDTEQELKWEVTSPSIIINYEVKLRRAPVSGQGEDWVSVHVPASADTSAGAAAGPRTRTEAGPRTRTEAYLLRGLEMGTSYQVKVRGRNKYGYSHSSSVWTFSTYSPYTTTTPGPTRAPQVINWREHQEFSKNLLSNQLPSSSQIINTKRAQELASSSGRVYAGPSSSGRVYAGQLLVMWLVLCVV